MTKAFIERVMREYIVDTRNYRYTFKDCGDHGEIRRIALDCLGTTAAINGWEPVKEIKANA